MESIRIDGLKWIKLLFNNVLELEKLHFNRPQFELRSGEKDGERPNSGKSFQNLFADLLSRVQLNDFELSDGSIEVWQKDSTNETRILSVEKININAYQVVTDSIQMKNLIPFQLDRLQTDIENIQFRLDPYTVLNIGHIDYRNDSSQLTLRNLNVSLNEDRRTVSRKVGYQKDIFEASIEMVRFKQLTAQSSLYDSLNIEAGFIEIDSLVFDDFRNKNIPRPDEPIKPLFNGIVNSIPFPVRVDSVLIRRSYVTYAELAAKQETVGAIEFTNINGQISNITNDTLEQKRLEMMKIRLDCGMYGQSNLSFNVDVPYGNRAFFLNAELRNIDLVRFNPMILPLTGLEITEGNLDHFQLQMNASFYSSQNRFRFDYSGLKVDLLVASRTEEFKDLGWLSGLANSAVSPDNIPGSNGYTDVQSYSTERNIRRSPFNYMWLCIKDGMAIIVPSDVASLFIDQKN